MSDNPAKSEPIDAPRIDLSDAQQIDYWRRDQQRFIEAVAAVGNAVDDVRGYLKR